MTQVMAALKFLMKILTAPLWFFDAIDKEAFVLSLPLPVRKRALRIMFWPTLAWTLLLHKMMPEQRRWYDRIDSRVIIGALPLKSDLPTLARIERVTGLINFCDEFDGHSEYEAWGMRQLRLPTLDYTSPTAQQLETGLDFIRRQPPGGSVYVHCKAGRGRAGTMLMAYMIDDKGMSPSAAQAALLAARPHVSPRLWKRPAVRELSRRVQQRALAAQAQAARADAEAAAYAQRAHAGSPPTASAPSQPQGFDPRAAVGESAAADGEGVTG
uniref:Protein-tyrosine-phosphatase n=1 Tax=Haptolina brevifila TaxID=156173 RepID=A0A7S2GLA7_9EUKA|mmetsp:Transcript_4194/g.9184  ORF Transcript_4194/g.9184 Transcript_4194/m.9184 type:complete len:270 (+) Transcript_4194:2-811(+)